MSLNHFSEIFMPYCIERTFEGWVVMNREYQPLGTPYTTAWEKNHSEKFIPVKLDIPEKFLSTLKHYEHRPDMYWLYDDTCNPALSKKNADRYAKIIMQLAKYKVKNERR